SPMRRIVARVGNEARASDTVAKWQAKHELRTATDSLAGRKQGASVQGDHCTCEREADTEPFMPASAGVAVRLVSGWQLREHVENRFERIRSDSDTGITHAKLDGPILRHDFERQRDMSTLAGVLARVVEQAGDDLAEADGVRMDGHA